MTDIVWEDPPEGTLGDFLAELQKHPGKWAISHQGAPSLGLYALREQRLKALGCDAVARKKPDGTYAIYARWPEAAS